MFYLYDYVVSLLLLLVFNCCLKVVIKTRLLRRQSSWLLTVHKLPVNDHKLARNFAKSCSKVASFLKKLLILQKVARYENKS